MKVADSTPAAFRKIIKGRRVLCFGSGDYFKLFVFDFGNATKILGIIDNDASKHGTIVIAGNISTTVLSLAESVQIIGTTDTILVITAAAYREIIIELQAISDFENVTCYVYAQIKYSVLKSVDRLPHICDKLQIPPIIHYCWFGGKPLPESLRQCVDSWKRVCPGYKIMEWNEKNYDYHKNAWTAAAFKQGQWTYLVDYARIDMIAAYGGIYLDTDVELLQSLDILRCYKGFVATEAHGGINFGSGFGAIAGLHVFQELLAGFDREFEHGVTFCSNVGRETDIFWRNGYQLNGKLQVIKEVAILPFNVLTPAIADTNKRFISNATVGVHYFNRGWKK